jgi:signal transduction histidine kinase
MFRSARLKLTLFYLAILLGFSLVLTMTVRIMAEREYNRSLNAQLGEVKHMFVGFPWKDVTTEVTVMRPDRALSSIQDDQAVMVRQHLNRDFAIINGAALMVGGVLSYWFAGRTLRPIEQAHRAQARFASDASHELRTPLASMRVENEVFLRQKDFSQQEAREQIESNLEEVQRLENLSSNLLALTHYEHASLPRTITDIRPIVEEAVARARKNTDQRDITIVQKIDNAKLLIHGDSIVQLLDILFDNARKYGPRGGEITVIGRKQNSQYLLQVQDQGPGIDESDLPHIFERLYRSDKARTSSAGGYGLGLALANEIAKANQGTIAASNNKGGGACLSVRLEMA